MQNWFPTHT